MGRIASSFRSFIRVLSLRPYLVLVLFLYIPRPFLVPLAFDFHTIRGVTALAVPSLLLSYAHLYVPSLLALLGRLFVRLYSTRITFYLFWLAGDWGRDLRSLICAAEIATHKRNLSLTGFGLSLSNQLSLWSDIISRLRNDTGLTHVALRSLRQRAYFGRALTYSLLPSSSLLALEDYGASIAEGQHLVDINFADGGSPTQLLSLAHLSRSCLHFSLDNFEQCIDDAEESIRLRALAHRLPISDPTAFECQSLSAESYYRLSRYEECVGATTRVIDVAAPNAEMSFLLYRMSFLRGCCRLQSAEFDAAVADLTHARQFCYQIGGTETDNPTCKVLMTLASCYLHTERYPECIEICDEVIRILRQIETSPFHFQSHFVKGLASLLSNQTLNALSSFQLCIEELDCSLEDQLSTFYLLGISQLKSGDFGPAAASFACAIDSLEREEEEGKEKDCGDSVKAVMFFLRGVARTLCGDREGGVEDCERSIQEDFGDAIDEFLEGSSEGVFGFLGKLHPSNFAEGVGLQN